jgi:hypothetical protein
MWTVLIAHQNVLRLKISVNEAAFMQLTQTCHTLKGNSFHINDGDGRFVNDVLQVLAEQSHYKAAVLLIFALDLGEPIAVLKLLEYFAFAMDKGI